MMISNSIWLGYLFMIGLGATFPGRNIAGLNLLMEYMHLTLWQERCVVAYMYFEPIIEIYFVVYYRYISNDRFGIELTFLFMTIIVTFLIQKYFPESPKLLY